MSETPATAAQEETLGSIEISGTMYRTVTIPLSRPVMLGGQMVSSLTMREPTGDDLIKSSQAAGAENGGFARSGAMLSLLVQLPVSELGRIPAGDFLRLDRRMNRFLESGQ